MITAGGVVWVSIAEGAEDLGVTANRIYKWVRLKKLSVMKFPSGALMVRLDDLYDVLRDIELRHLQRQLNRSVKVTEGMA